jgi:cytochrome c oxidase subunit II
MSNVSPKMTSDPTSATVGTMRRRIRIGLVLALGALAAGCAEDAPQDMWRPAGPNANSIYDLSLLVFILAGIVGVVVLGLVFFTVFKFRDRGQAIPEQIHGKPTLEIVLTIIPALILVGIAIPTVGTLLALNDTSDTECVINVTGQQWWWEIDYPTQDGCGSGISEPIITSGQMVIPVGTPVLVRGTSRDVIHSWWIPRLNGKRDMVPGRVHTNKIEADEPGVYAGQCTEFCGLSHANMRMEVIALSAEDFETWKQNQLAEYQAPEEGTLAATGEQTFLAQCARCHQVNGLEDADGDPVVSRPDLQVYAGAAPNLSHLMTRTTFAGASWSLLTRECSGDQFQKSPDEVGEWYLRGVTPNCLNSVQFREWLRNAPAMKPMYADAEKLEETDGLVRGMPNLALSEDQIDELVAYLLERK